MTPGWLARVALAASLVAARGAEAQVQDGRLGAPCAADADCSAGLICLLPQSTELGPGGPAGGLCTLQCAVDDDCRTVNETAVCESWDDTYAGYCFESCTINSWFGPELDPTKCHGRQDMVCDSFECSPLCLGAAICFPHCARDDQCGVGLFCNPADGLCESSPSEGDPPGSPCDVSADACSGWCYGGVCLEPCVIGAPLTCSSSTGGSSQGAACVIPWDGSGVGDYGLCAELCDCSSECPDTTFCEPWDFGGRFDAAGVCTPGPRPSAAPDCLNGSAGSGSALGCTYGAVHACKTAACLGTADCLPSGEYSECKCIASGDAGSADAGAASGGSGSDAGGAGPAGTGGESAPRSAAGQAPDAGCGCSVPRTHRGSAALALLGVLIAIARLRKLSRERQRGSQSNTLYGEG
jgi:MYXO-CTERM domain-containing protein